MKLIRFLLTCSLIVGMNMVAAERSLSTPAPSSSDRVDGLQWTYDEEVAILGKQKADDATRDNPFSIPQEVQNAAREGAAIRIKHEVFSSKEQFEAIMAQSVMPAHALYITAKALYKKLPPKPAARRTALDGEILDLYTNIEAFMVEKASEALNDFEKQLASNEHQLEELIGQPVDKARHLRHIKLINKQLEIATTMREYNPSLPTDECDRLRETLRELEKVLKKSDEPQSSPVPPSALRHSTLGTSGRVVPMGTAPQQAPASLAVPRHKRLGATAPTPEQIPGVLDAIERGLEQIKQEAIAEIRKSHNVPQKLAMCSMALEDLIVLKGDLTAHKDSERGKPLFDLTVQLIEEVKELKVCTLLSPVEKEESSAWANVMEQRRNRRSVFKFAIGGVVAVAAAAVIAYFWFKRPVVAAH